jgi:hypothetical protein
MYLVICLSSPLLSLPFFLERSNAGSLVIQLVAPRSHSTVALDKERRLAYDIRSLARVHHEGHRPPDRILDFTSSRKRAGSVDNVTPAP